ncbi:hypothetical protein BDR03DRAFT_296678 [Suillus americanus]|nr:hypothetical protein BDR03DRAFT_296678 [Suillus americanus]
MKQDSRKKPRKAQTRSHYQTIMYPGAENSPLNRKRGYCTDNVKQVLKDTEMSSLHGLNHEESFPGAAPSTPIPLVFVSS